MFTGRRWSQIPFCYERICLTVGGMLLFCYMGILIYLYGIIPAAWWRISSYGGVVLLILLVWWALTAGWQSVDRWFSGALPYDAKAVAEGRGTIHSYSELWVWLKNHLKGKRLPER